MAVIIERLDLSAGALAQTVGWSTVRDGPVSLVEFIASRGPEVAPRFGITPSDEPVKALWEMTQKEFRNIVLQRIREGTTPTRLNVRGKDISLNPHDMARGVEHDTRIGQRITDVTGCALRLLESLIIDGRVFPQV